MAAETFQYLYSVNLNPNNGKFHVVDGDGNNAALNPLKQGVTVTDNITDAGGDNAGKLGDVAADHFTLSGAGGALNLNGTYSFVTRAVLGGGLQGFVVQSSGGQYFFLTDNQILLQGNAPGSSRLLAPESGPLTICFMPGTHVAAPDGAVPVEDLEIGDLVLTADGRHVPVRWIGRQTVSSLFMDELDLPIRILAGALGENMPCRDLLLSPEHALFVDGILIHAGALVNGTSITRERNVPSTFVYYHVEVGDHSLILAENTPAETFVDNVDRAHFDNWAEYEALYAEGRPTGEMAFPRAKSYRQVPKAIRERLAARAAGLLPQQVEAAA